MLAAFIYGVVLAFGLIIPLGIQNVFVFNQGATQRHFIHALPCVLTAFICDAILILLAVLGVSAVVLEAPLLKTIIFIIGFFFLMYMGLLTWRSSTVNLQKNKKPFSAKHQITFAASVSLLNPHALIDTVAVIGVNSLHFTGSDKWAYTIACILVSFFWFCGLAISGHFLHKLDKTGLWLLIVNKISALIIWGVGLFIAWELIKLL